MSHPPTVVGAMVLLTSGIVAERLACCRCSPQYCLSSSGGGRGTWWVLVGSLGLGTLLGPEESGRPHTRHLASS